MINVSWLKLDFLEVNCDFLFFQHPGELLFYYFCKSVDISWIPLTAAVTLFVTLFLILLFFGGLHV